MNHILLFAVFILCSTQTIQTMDKIAIHSPYFCCAETIKCLQEIYNNDNKRVKKALKQGADVNYVDEHGKSLLYIACSCRHTSIIKTLLKQENIDVTIGKPIQNISPLHLVCNNNQPEAVQLILQKNPKALDEYDYEKNNPLHYACVLLHKSCIKKIITVDKNSINKQNIYGETSLHLLLKKHTIDALDKQLKLFKLLIRHGADITIRDNLQETPLFLLFNILNNGSYSRKIIRFIEKNKDFIQQLVLTTDAHTNTQFHLCPKLEFIHKESFQKYLSFLHNWGLDIQARNNKGKRAADLACETFEFFYRVYTTENLFASDFFECQKNLMCQEIRLHRFLCFTAPFIQAADFKAVLEKKSHENISLPKDVITYIMQYYYLLNIETVIAQKYKSASAYYNMSIEGKNNLKWALLVNPEPHLLWSNLVH